MATRVETLTVQPYTVALRRALTVSGRTMRERHGLVVCLADSAGRCGYGDAAPLPGLHTESVDAVGAAVPAARATWSDLDAADADAVAAAAVATDLPSLRFALESAWLHLRAQQCGAPAAHVLDTAARTRVPVNGLLDGDAATARTLLDSGVMAGYPTVKVKVGRREPSAERSLLSLLAEELPEPVSLRLDANRSLSLDDACALLAGIDADRIEYFEEPLADPSRWTDLHQRTGVRIGVDESLELREGIAPAWLRAPAVHAWVLKPSHRSGVLGSLALARSADQHGIACVISACFESGIGLWSLAHLAAAVPREIATGIGTDAWLAHDVIAPRFCSSQGWIQLADAVNTPTLATTP